MESEKFRGIFTAIVSGLSSGGLNQMLMYLNVPVLYSTTLSIYIFGNILAYTIDILFAKRKFLNKIVSYSDISYRFQWLLNSFISIVFVKFILVALIDTLLGITLLKFLLKQMDDRKIHFKFRNLIMSGAVAVFTFFLYVNILRFDWVYKENTDDLSNVTVVTWASIIIMIFSNMNCCQNSSKHLENN